jgi:hypothetical protein
MGGFLSSRHWPGSCENECNPEIRSGHQTIFDH